MKESFCKFIMKIIKQFNVFMNKFIAAKKNYNIKAKL